MPLWLLPLLRSRWLHLGLMALACGLLWMRGSHYRDDRDRWHSAFTAQKAAYVAAQEAATAKAIAAKLAAEARYRDQAEKIDVAYREALDDARGASERYARSHSVRAESVAGPRSGSTTPADNRHPKEPSRSGPDAVVVGRDDFDILVENSVRLEAAHQWAKTLNQPLPDPAFGQ